MAIEIINLTQHLATPEQLTEGVMDMPKEERAQLVRLLTVDEVPTWEEILNRCADIAQLACHNGLGGDDGDDPHPTKAMIGGAPAMMAPLEAALHEVGIEPIYAFSKRISVDQHQPDGSVRKVMDFRHIGWWPSSTN